MTIAPDDSITRAVAAQFTGADPATTHPDLMDVIEAAIAHQPRSLQVRIGPSEIGMPCRRCLVHKLAGTPMSEEAAWLPFIGTCVHEELEHIVMKHETTKASLGMPHRYLPEAKVTVGVVDGVPITGHSDLFDTHTGTVVDYKVVGANTLAKVKSKGAKDQYRIQAHAYGKGWEDAGYQVRSVLVWFMPRNDLTLRRGLVWQEPYDRSVAEEAIADVDALARAIRTLGVDTVLAGTAPHTDDDDSFTCRRYPDYVPASRAQTTEADVAEVDLSTLLGSNSK